MVLGQDFLLLGSWARIWTQVPNSELFPQDYATPIHNSALAWGSRQSIKHNAEQAEAPQNSLRNYLKQNRRVKMRVWGTDLQMLSVICSPEVQFWDQTLAVMLTNGCHPYFITFFKAKVSMWNKTYERGRSNNLLGHLPIISNFCLSWNVNSVYITSPPNSFVRLHF